MHIAEVRHWLKGCRSRLQVVIFLYQLSIHQTKNWWSFLLVLTQSSCYKYS